MLAIAACLGAPVDPSAAERDLDAGLSTTDAPAVSDVADAPVGAPRDARPSHRLSPAFVPFDVNHVLSTGQSLSVGFAGKPPLSLAQPFANLMFTSGVLAGSLDEAGTAVEEGGLDDFAPLVEGDVVPRTNDPVETMSSGLANLVAGLARSDPDLAIGHDLLVSVHGMSATAYYGLKTGTAPYALGMAQVEAARDRAKALGKSYVVRAVTTVHGESDHIEGNTHYANDLVEWQRDYEADVKALTGQAQPVPLLETQVSAYAPSAIPQAQLDAHVTAPGKVVLVGPKYHLPYADGMHLTNEGYRHLGEDYAKVYRRVVLEEQPWEPVRPKAIARRGDSIFVTFHVPSPPLVIDTTLVAAAPSYGFSFTDGSPSPPPIFDVQVVAPDTVRVRLDRAPAGPGRLRYAYVPARGNLRDSDATPSRHSYALYNWCVHFAIDVP
jgi:hypothetical protein